MKLNLRPMKWLSAVFFAIPIVVLSEKPEASTVFDATKAASESISLDVYKSRTCGCCEKWIEHLEDKGFNTAVHHPADLNKLKLAKGIKPRYQSCHTAVSKDGFIIEGHVPADIIQKFLAERPLGAIGLAVPGMPLGSPGMEVGKRRDDYSVLQLNKDGSAEIYEFITSRK